MAPRAWGVLVLVIMLFWGHPAWTQEWPLPPSRSLAAASLDPSAPFSPPLPPRRANGREPVTNSIGAAPTVADPVEQIASADGAAVDGQDQGITGAMGLRDLSNLVNEATELQGLPLALEGVPMAEWPPTQQWPPIGEAVEPPNAPRNPSSLEVISAAPGWALPPMRLPAGEREIAALSPATPAVETAAPPADAGFLDADVGAVDGDGPPPAVTVTPRPGWDLPPRREGRAGIEVAAVSALPEPTETIDPPAEGEGGGPEPAEHLLIDLIASARVQGLPPIPPERPAAPVLPETGFVLTSWPVPPARPQAPPPGFIEPQDLARHGMSPGCGRTAPATPPTTLIVSGEARDMIVDLTEPPTPDSVYRLIVAFHGRTNTNDQVQRYYDLDENSRRPTILVYPEGLNHGTGRHGWFNGGWGAEQQDYAFFDRILGTFAAQYCLDLDQVYAVGHSMGGSMTSSLGCARGEVLRGVAVVAGGLSGRPTCSGPVAAIVIHHPEDRLVSFDQGESIRDALLGQNGLRPIANASGPAALNCTTYGSETANPVVWCPHDRGTSGNGRYYPHRWPDEAGPAVMRFFDGL